MKIAFSFGKFILANRLVSINNLWKDPRGLTGSEVSFFCYAHELKKRGHDVDIYIESHERSGEWNGMKVRSFDEFMSQYRTDYDAVCSWCEPDTLRNVHPKAVRLCNQQVNDFLYAKPGFDDAVDVFTSPASHHMAHMQGWGNTTASKWCVLPNGCDTSWYPKRERRKHSVVWASSPDRGLHLLLGMWPKIRARVPDANLRVFYNMAHWVQANRSLQHRHPHLDETSRRANYVYEALLRMPGKDWGIEIRDSTSREQMIEELATAEVLAYCCDTFVYTEGFSVTLMEACASGMVPITTSVDSLGTIYREAVPMVEAPVRDRLDEYVNLVVRALTDEDFKASVLKKTLPFAEKYSYQKGAETLEGYLLQAKSRKT